MTLLHRAWTSAHKDKHRVWPGRIFVAGLPVLLALGMTGCTVGVVDRPVPAHSYPGQQITAPTAPEPPAQPAPVKSPATSVTSGADSFSVDETPKPADPASLELVLEVSNPMVVSNGGKPPSFTLTEPRRVREISTYHWNDGKGTAAGGTITLTGPGTTRVFKVARTGDGQGGVPNAVWIVDMDMTLQPGTYTVSDSDPSTWAQNSGTKGLGMTWVRAEKR